MVLRECNNAENIDVIDVSSVAEVGEIYGALSSGELVYDNVVLDSMTEISEWLFADLENTLTDKQKDFGGLYTTFKQRIINITKMFRDLKGVNVVFLALADMIEINGTVKIVPSLPHKKSQMSVVALFDEVLLLESDNSGTRHLRTTDSNMHVAKSRMGIEDNTTVIDFGELYPSLVKSNDIKKKS